MAVTFLEHVLDTRKIKFDVSGKTVTRRLPAMFAGSVDDMVRAIAQGLAIEEASGELKADNGTKIASKTTTAEIAAQLTIVPGAVLVADPVSMVP